MGLLNNLFGKKDEVQEKHTERITEVNTIYAPLDGQAISLEDFPDEVMRAEVLGKGCGIIPNEECVKAPFEGEIIQVADTKHAVGIKSLDGIELLIHIGVDTVEMNGKGFQTFVKVGDTVSLGQKLIAFSREEIRKAGYIDAVAMIITNSDDYQEVNLEVKGNVTCGNRIMAVK